MLQLSDKIVSDRYRSLRRLPVGWPRDRRTTFPLKKEGNCVEPAAAATAPGGLPDRALR